MQWLVKNIQHFKITTTNDEELKQQVGKYWLKSTTPATTYYSDGRIWENSLNLRFKVTVLAY